MNKNFKVIESDLNLIIDEFDTIEEAVKCVDECIKWDRNNPQSYVPSYRIERCV